MNFDPFGSYQFIQDNKATVYRWDENDDPLELEENSDSNVSMTYFHVVREDMHVYIEDFRKIVVAFKDKQLTTFSEWNIQLCIANDHHICVKYDNHNVEVFSIEKEEETVFF